MTLSFDEFVDKTSDELNLKLRSYKLKRVKRRTDSLMRRYEINDYKDCFNLIKNDIEFKDTYLNHFTINTSEFFRNPKNFEYMKKNVFPDLFRKLKNPNTDSPLRIWSAPCSNGSEPYTMVIILTEMGYTTNDFKITGSDLDPEILKAAKKGIYNSTATKNIPDKILQKYFTLIPGHRTHYKLDSHIRRQVDLEKKDLINEKFKSNWDLILSRNFFIYLTRDVKDIITQKFADVLKPGGYLFLGNTEFIFTPEKYGLKKIHSSFYQKLT